MTGKSQTVIPVFICVQWRHDLYVHNQNEEIKPLMMKKRNLSVSI